MSSGRALAALALLLTLGCAPQVAPTPAPRARPDDLHSPAPRLPSPRRIPVVTEPAPTPRPSPSPSTEPLPSPSAEPSPSPEPSPSAEPPSASPTPSPGAQASPARKPSPSPRPSPSPAAAAPEPPLALPPIEAQPQDSYSTRVEADGTRTHSVRGNPGSGPARPSR